jgi:diguanylate cyclase (GGDEF)-like protein
VVAHAIKDDVTMERKTKTTRRKPADLRLIEEIGSAAGQLMSTISDSSPATATERRVRPARPVLFEQALGAAEEVESFLAEQTARIAYLENLTLTDELTGLRNRRGFNEQLRRTLASANRYGDEGVLVFCDLDNFKVVNDTYGHHVGDFVLKKVAKVLEAEVRETDMVARLGGDEFAVLMVQTNWRDGFKRAQMLCRAVNRTIVTHNGHEIPVSASFGVEPFGPNDEEINLIARADMAMYINKRKKASVSLNSAAE